MREVDELRVDRTTIEVVAREDIDDLEDIAYWLAKSPLARLGGIEAIRQSMYSYDPVSERLPRFFEVIGPE